MMRLAQNLAQPVTHSASRFFRVRVIWLPIVGWLSLLLAFFLAIWRRREGMIPASKTLQATAYDPARPLPLLFGEGTKLKITSAFELHSMMEKGFPSELVIAPAT
ncbi:hypothetical protein HBO43_28940 [Pseudomonas veronii]|jgi:hypothetical protein|uniref:Uncharacterized protein n=2 Tax=Pseudomonas veronii TaxID=76761 RepID=A0A7Y0ZZC6_PSEVE|nr:MULTISPECIES: hypothetical protein [Pseudomonas]MBJ2181484.1 hypothetical protein [Pseudomonas veronii]MCT9827136.1 hypothetical protein [Pseudomonas veronii]NMX37222.1 hypothetical protein [Pseudomonas veronii]NMY00608.1 hypothetical protein [Pseudomonas veronii]